jgi:hypothetical protein
MRARYYEPGSGRFISEDPARDGLNWFAYCDNDPVLNVDATGKHWEMIVEGFKFLFHDSGGGHLHIYDSKDTELFSRRLSGGAWHGDGGKFPQEVLEALVKAVKAGNNGALRVIKRLASGGFGIGKKVLRALKAAAGITGLVIYAYTSIDAYAQFDPAGFADIIATIGGFD